VPSRVDSFLEKTASPAPFLTASLQKLVLLGADFGVMVCNTAHIYFDEIATKVNLPLINMEWNDAMHVSGLKLEGRVVGLLATAATVKSGLYPCYFNGFNVEIVITTDEEQDLVTSAIFESEYGIKATGINTSDAAVRCAADTGQKKCRQLDQSNRSMPHLQWRCSCCSWTLLSTQSFESSGPFEEIGQCRVQATVPRVTLG
jgi:aspartate/glutamate racemase